ncbi:MAG: sugar phosphate isomerase/epimerase [Lachnospiraceae bacterium]|jgi:sugar phosphate isomerase/epimerase|nr:sugar phosphate isomerase/epimerase [Lachnospiraceae bacterium]
MERIIGVNSNCYHGYRIEEALEGIAAAGFHYVELTATKGWTEHVFPSQSFEYLIQVKERMKKLGLAPFAMSGHCNLMDKERLQDFIMNIRLAAFFGCDYIVSSVGEAHLEDKDKGSDELVAEHIRMLLPYLEEYQMSLVLESHGEHATGAVLKGITDRVDSPRVGINYDTANVIFYGNVDPVSDMDSCMGDIRYMHLKDKAGETKEWNFPAPGKGTVDFPEIFKKLEKSGNACPFSIEIEFTPEGPGSLETVNQAVRDSAEYLKSLGMEL